MGTFSPSSSSSYGQSPSYGSNTGSNHAMDYGHGSIGIPGDIGIGQPPYVSGVAGQRYGKSVKGTLTNTLSKQQA